MKDWMKNQCNQLKNCKCTIVLCVVFYIFVCLFGNIITGVFIYYLRLKAEDYETVAGTILRSLDISEKKNISFDNITFELDDILATLEGEAQEITESFGFISIDNESNISESESICYESIGDYDEIRKSMQYWIEGVAILTVSIFGLIGNLLSILILRQIKPRQRFNTLLTVLAVIDCLLIIDTSVQRSIVPYFLSTSPINPIWYKLSFPYFWHPFRGIIRTITTYMMVMISCDRYRAVCYPFHRKYSITICIATVIASSIVLKIPLFFQFRIVTIGDVQEYWTTSIMDSPEYLSFNFYWDELFTSGVLPLAVTIFLNTRIYLKIRASAKLTVHRFVGSTIANNLYQSEVSASNQKSSNAKKCWSTSRGESQSLEILRHLGNASDDTHINSSCNKDPSNPPNKPLRHQTQRSISTQLKVSTYKSATILISMVVLFLLTHFYRVTLKIYEISTPKHNMKDFTFCISQDRYHVPFALYILININNLFLVINSSINIVIYFLIGKEFRKHTTKFFQEIFIRLESIFN